MAKATRSPDRKEQPPTNIREMELDDLSAVFKLGERIFTAEKQPNLYRTWDEYELIELFASDGDFCLVAEQEDLITGFAMGTLIEKRRSAWKYGWLIWLGVTPGLERRGLGNRLTDRLTDRFIEHGARMMIVDTQRNNEHALRFFKKQGFGNATHHVYLSKNLTTHPEYRKKKEKQERQKNSRTGRRSSSPAPKDDPHPPPEGIGLHE